METIVRWCRRFGILATATVGPLLIPSAAWAQPGPAAEAAGAPLAKGAAIAAAGGLSILCCLAVVAIVVGAIAMIVRRRRR